MSGLSVRHFGDAADPRGRHERLAGVNIGDDGYPQRQVRRPGAGLDRIARDVQHVARLDGDRIPAKAVDPRIRPPAPCKNVVA